MVKSVGFDPITRKFIVAVRDLANDIIKTDQVFDYVLNCTGHFSVPNMPKFDGMHTFPGRIMHSHDFRSAEEFAGKRILVLGAHYSSEDIALQTMKFGAKSVVCSYRTRPTGFKWPWGIQERPLLTKVDGKVATFWDGSTAEVSLTNYHTI